MATANLQAAKVEHILAGKQLSVSGAQAATDAAEQQRLAEAEVARKEQAEFEALLQQKVCSLGLGWSRRIVNAQINETAQFRQLKRMLQEKNDEIRRLRIEVDALKQPV